MKKAIALILILLVGLFILEGCSSNDSKANENSQQPNSEQQKAQSKQDSSIPQPPALPKD